MRRFLLTLAVLGSCGPTASADPAGEWLVEDGRAHIRTALCDGRLWGVVTWEQEPGTDAKNPDPTLRNRPTLGLPIILGMAPVKANRWEGSIYNAENGKTYQAEITLKQPNLLEVKGCVLSGWVCSSEDWRRLQPPQQSVGSIPPTDLCLRLRAGARRSHESGLK